VVEREWNPLRSAEGNPLAMKDTPQVRSPIDRTEHPSVSSHQWPVIHEHGVASAGFQDVANDPNGRPLPRVRVLDANLLTHRQDGESVGTLVERRLPRLFLSLASGSEFCKDCVWLGQARKIAALSSTEECLCRGESGFRRCVTPLQEGGPEVLALAAALCEEMFDVFNRRFRAPVG